MRRHRSLLWTGAVALVALPALAQIAPPGRTSSGVSVVTNPDWVSQPDYADILEAYPADALMRRLAGRGNIDCRVTAMGELTACTLKSEDPPGSGFGAAAIGLAPTFRMRPHAHDGRPMEGARVTVPLRFEPPPLPVEPLHPGQARMGVITDPDWVRLPSPDEIAAAYRPPLHPRVSRGLVWLRCTATDSGGLAACRVVSEDPAGAGFAAAALRLAPYFQMRRRSADGRPVEGASVTIPIRFSLRP